MKIRLIQPAQLDEKGNVLKLTKLFIPHLAMPTIAGLTPKNIDVQITEDYVEDINFNEEVDLIGITGLTSQATRAYQIADEFRKRGKKTIMGGIHASMCPQEVLEHCDSVVIGEVEEIWEQILNDVKSNNLKTMYQAQQRPNLSRLVIPRFDLLNFKNYLIPTFAKTPLIPIQTSRGCPNQCDFCAVTTFLGHQIRKKPIAHVIREIETIKPSRIFFTDDNICGDPNYAKELFKALTPLKIRWAGQMSTTIIKHPELIELAAKSGCHETFMGIESISTESLKIINKEFNNVNRYEELFQRLSEVGILATTSFVFGLDADTAESLRKTIDTVLNWHINYIVIFILTPFPGTKLYNRMEKEGRIMHGDWKFYDAIHPLIKFKNIHTTELNNIVWDSYQKFYSLKNIFRRAWRFKKQYIKFFPRDFILEELAFSLMMRKSVNIRKHPFTLGLIKNNA